MSRYDDEKTRQQGNEPGQPKPSTGPHNPNPPTSNPTMPGLGLPNPDGDRGAGDGRGGRRGRPGTKR
jgi:hypothetical protein